MEGYVKNNSPTWRHALKRSVGPGEKIPLDDLYEQYGIKHEIEKGEPFVVWLRKVKLRNDDIWEIKYRDVESESISGSENTSIQTGKDEATKSKQSTPFVQSQLEPEELAGLSVRKARNVIPKLTDQKILKYALNMASQLSNKDTLCRMLRKRIQELELSRR